MFLAEKHKPLGTSIFFAASSASKLNTSRGKNLVAASSTQKGHPFVLDLELGSAQPGALNRQHTSMKINGLQKVGEMICLAEEDPALSLQNAICTHLLRNKVPRYIPSWSSSSKQTDRNLHRSSLNSISKNRCKGNLPESTQKGRPWRVIQKRYQTLIQALITTNLIKMGPFWKPSPP